MGLPQGNTQVNVVLPKPGAGPLDRPLPNISGVGVVQIPAEAFEFYNSMVDPAKMYLNDLTRTLFASQLVHTGISDPSSPLPGYSLVRLQVEDGEGKMHRLTPNTNATGYLTFAGLWILATSSAISSTNWKKNFDIEEFALDETMGIIDQLTANADAWELADDELIYTLALPLYKNILAVGMRSHKGGWLDILKNMFANNRHPEQQKPPGLERFIG